MTRVELPKAVLDFAARGPDWAAHVDRLPGLIRDLLDEWDLERDGVMLHGHGSVVLPVLADGVPGVLKVGFPDVETEHEALALQRWGGRGAVRLLRADPHRRAVLLERLLTADLTGLWDLEACDVVAGLYGLIHVPAPPQLATVTSYVGRWTGPLAALPRDAPIPRRLVEQAVGLARELADDPGSTGTLVHGDLHYENVLAAEREPWLVIDPHPMSGDPHYEPAPMLWNRWEELAGDIRGGVRRRFHALLDAASLDEDRARAWVVVRMVVNAYWSIEDAERAGRALDQEEREWITCCVAVAKAVQD
ncbi:MAG: Aminoglycoside/hydroxyurea antibiotic resistance kinase [Nocardioides sp.]|nr:Aminoglycoside/hydroxyurea antibiotic resistance kinase [Nocardioides sp.]